MAHGVIDWSVPWLQPWRADGQLVSASGLPLHDALNVGWAASLPTAPNVSGGQQSCPPYADADPTVGWAAPLPTVTFVPQTALPAGTPYERYIFESKQVPVREGLHDFFNGLVWRAFPRTKSALNRLQAEAIARDGIHGKRGAVRDAITVFDENGAILDAPDALWDALLAREWQRLFVELRPLWSQARLLIFGHALLEQLARPRKGLTAHVWAERPSGFPGELDAWLSGRTTAERLETKPFTPLPVLGVPGWWPDNEDISFYDDPLVFRPRRA